jgi:hypothetical protein
MLFNAAQPSSLSSLERSRSARWLWWRFSQLQEADPTLTAASPLEAYGERRPRAMPS